VEGGRNFFDEKKLIVEEKKEGFVGGGGGGGGFDKGPKFYHGKNLTVYQKE